jgi:hypothetical protein
VDVRSTLVGLPTLELVVSRADPFPQGVQAAFERIESRLPTLRGRKLYGVTFDRQEGLEYYAGVVPEHEGEAAALGLPILAIDAGLWARTRLHDWEQSIDKIPAVVDALAEKHGMDDSRPVLEFYRSRTELDVLVPARTSARGARDDEQGGGP